MNAEPQLYNVGNVYQVNVNDLQPNPHQPRKYFAEDELSALAKDIESNGLLQNITFTRDNGQLYIVSGERRVRAHQLLNRDTIEGKYVEGDLQTLALMENIQRSDLTAVELAEAVSALQEQKQYSNDEVAALIGKAKSTTSEILKIAELPEDIRADVRVKPCMTRERLLKIARTKDADAKQLAYLKLCEFLAPREPADDKPKDTATRQHEKKAANQHVTAQVRTIEGMAQKLIESHQKMLEKLKGDLKEEEISVLVQALDALKGAIDGILNSDESLQQ